MPLSQLRNVNFGKSRTGLSGSVGYTLYGFDNTVESARTTDGIFETVSGSGLYHSFISFPDDFRGFLVWDTGEVPGRIQYATEQYNYEENNPNIDLILSSSTQSSGTIEQIAQDVTYISSSIPLIQNQLTDIETTVAAVAVDVSFIKAIEGGRWIIDENVNQMIFYQDDNVTEVARFNLFDVTGSAASESVYERVRV